MTLGRASTGATAVWMSTVHAFSQDADPRWIEASARAAGELDPTWRIPWMYGSLMLAAMGELDAHRRLLQAAMAVHPSDPWFPMVLALSHRIDGGDRDAALRWMSLAADLPHSEPLLDRIVERWRQP